MEQIKNEINTLDGRIKKIKQQVDLASTDNDIKQQMAEFLEVIRVGLLILLLTIAMSTRFDIVVCRNRLHENPVKFVLLRYLAPIP